MKKTGWIELCNTVKRTWVSFLAILLFVACASALFTGIHWTISAISLCLEQEYDDGNLYHFKVQSNLGFPEEVVEDLRNAGYTVEPFHETYRFFTLDGQPYQAKTLMLTEQINTPLRVEGRLPEKANEAAIDSHFAGQHGVKIGDTLQFTTNQYISPVGLTEEEFRITAIMDTAEYMAKYEDTNGFSFASYANVNTVVYLPEASFNKEVFSHYFGFYIRSAELDAMETLSPEYGDRSAELKTEIADLLNASAEKHLGLPEEVIAGQYALTERNHNASLSGLKSVRDTFDKMQYSLVVLFVTISLLVCYSTVSRLVHEQSVLIGMKKAQGFSTGGIILPFVVYSELAAILGVILGVLAGYFAIQPITVGATKQTFLFGKVILYCNVTDMVIAALAITVPVLITVLIACYSLTSRSAFILLSGEESETKKTHGWVEKLPVIRKLPTYTQSAVKSCFENKRRIIATVIGVVGSTALVVSALTTYINLEKSLRINFESITRYDKTVLFEESDSREKIRQVLDEHGYSYAEALYTFGMTTLENGENVLTTLYVADDPDFYDMLRLQDPETGAPGKAREGIWINISYAENSGAKTGDILHFTDALGCAHDFRIEGIYDYYLLNYQIVMTKSLFESDFGGRKYEPNIFLIRTDGEGFDALKNDLRGIQGITAIQDYYSLQCDLFGAFLNIARAVVAVYLLLSVLLAIFILLNLYTMFVREKKNEAIILLINGYSRKSVETYFYTDTLILTVLGTLIGIVVGVINGRMSLDSFNNSVTHFLNAFSLPACIVGTVFSFALSFIMCRIALRKLKKFELSDISAD